MRRLSTLLIVGLTLQVCSPPTLAAPASMPLSCVGDCDGDGTVTVDELMNGVHITLGALPLIACPPFDYNRDGWVAIDEILSAVNAALNGCPDLPPRFPVGAYFWPDHAFGDTGSALRDLANFGLNTVVAYYEYIKPDVPPFSGQPDCHGLVTEAETFAIDFFVGSPRGSQLRPLDEATLTARLQATVDCVGASRRYRGWMFDEPELTGYDPALLARVIRTLRALDPGHQAWVNLSPYATDGQLQSFGANADVLGLDIYPIPEGHYGFPNESLSVVGEYTERAQGAASAGADVWMILQAFGYSDLNEGTEGRRPTPDELRFMVYDAVVHGARGVIFFGSHQLRNTIPLDEPVWDVGVRRAARELGIIGPLLLRGEPLNDVSAQPKSIVARGWRSCDSEILIATNASASPETGLLCFGDGVRRAYDIFEDRRPTVDRGCLHDEFEAYGVHIYRITR
jgi:hypothetical protein